MSDYKLKAKGVSFHNHAMCIIDFIKQDETYKLTIILFGGKRNKDFLSSFLYLNILLSYQDSKILSLSIDENLIDKNEIKLINVQEKSMEQFSEFGYECVLNSKNEPIIIIIGGPSTKTDIHLFNCVTHELSRQPQV